MRNVNVSGSRVRNVKEHFIVFFEHFVILKLVQNVVLNPLIN